MTGGPHYDGYSDTSTESDASSCSNDGVRNDSSWCCTPSKRRPSRSVREPEGGANQDGLFVQVQGGDDGLGAAGAAVASVSLDWSQLPPARPDPRLDLRRFLRMGDIVNLLGGNVWGHCVLLLGTPRAVEVPMLLDMEDPEEIKANPHGPRTVRVLQHRVPVYLCKILQSASNMLQISVGVCAVAVHPETLEVCVVKEARGGVQVCGGRTETVCGGRSGPVTAELLMSPMSNKTLDFANFILSVEETFRVPQDTKWSFRTAVRSYLRKATLDPAKYATDERKLDLAQKIGEKWTKRPICSTVPTRVWQKYLLKLSYAALRCPPARLMGEPDPEVTWVTNVLQIAPIKDDRVLPAELVKYLLETGVWRHVNFAEGPPNHRLADPPSRESEFFNQPYLAPSFRPFLPPEMVNPEGAPVRLGHNCFTLYCGMQYAKPQVLKNPDGTQTQWDGRCGPLRGPQCPACRWVENRLPNTPQLPVQFRGHPGRQY